MADIFAVQSEISRQVISQLGIALTPQESRALRTPPTDNLEAYQAYLRGLDLRKQPFLSPEHEFKAVSMFERATELDPRFAAAWAELSQTHSYLAFNTDRSLARINAARETMKRAVALDPNLKSVWLARTYFTYRCEEDYDAALAQLTEAVHRFPNDAEVLQTLGLVLRRKGRLREAAQILQQAFALNPKTVILLWAMGGVHKSLRNYQEADRFFQQATSLAPDQPMYWDERALNWLALTGDVSAAQAILAQAPIPDAPALMPTFFVLDFYARRYEKALSRLSAEAMSKQTPLARSNLLILASIARDRMGDHRGALAVAEANRAQLKELVRRFPKEPSYPAFLAIALAQLGRGDEACALAEKTAYENRRDAFGGPDMVELQAMAEAILGRDQAAIARLSWLLRTSYQSAISVHEIRLNPIWDPLRDDPEFENLLR
jgi:serine/threonine-protein kinase